jgi:hypothetical protein
MTGIYKRLLSSPALLWGIFFLGSFFFFEWNYRYWYRFMEQYSLFLYTEAYFTGLWKQPGGFNAYLTAFVNQFFLLPYAAPLCIASLLTLMSLLFALLLKRSLRTPALPAPFLSLCPAFLFWLYPVESVAFILTIVAGLAAACLYTCVEKPSRRYLAGAILVTLLYPLATPAHLLAAAGMCLYEWMDTGDRKGRRAALCLCAWACVLPLPAMRMLYVVPMREAFLGKHLFHPEYPLPASLWYTGCAFLLAAGAMYGLRRRPFPFPEKVRGALSPLLAVLVSVPATVYGGHPLEQAYHYDWLARRQDWEAIVRDVSKHPVRDKDALVYANLAYACTGRFNEALLRLPQIGEEGFIPSDPKTRLGLIEAAEVSWYLHHTAAAQRFAFVGVLSSERNIQPRLMQRLVETFLVNEEYKAAEKYIRILEKSAFYRRGARELGSLIHPGTSPEADRIRERRRLNPVTDNPYDPTKSFPSALAFLIDDHPDNMAAFEYGMGYLLLYKELGAFMHYMEALKERGEKLPVVYQEAICIYYTVAENNPEAFRSYAIDPEVYRRYQGYLQQMKTLSPALLKRQYGDTYYYYAQFVQPPKKPAL